jgi:predicted nucleotidyltransferase
LDNRSIIAREAARLLYYGVAKEYIQAKEIATTNFQTKVMPSNFEVALELDKLSEELEGSVRQAKLIEMRKTAKKIMTAVSNFQPLLIGSVWRGTIRKGSDIDIITLSFDPSKVGESIQKFELLEKGETNFKGGIKAYHYKITSEGFIIDIVVRRPDEYKPEKCDIYGDKKNGLSLIALEKLLNVDPLRRFVPKRRTR